MSELKDLIPGADVYVVERDDRGVAVDFSGYMFLAVAGHAVICTPFINDLETLEETLDYHIQETAEDYDTALVVVPVEDCYSTQYGAKEALKEEMEEETNE